jgi:chromosome segregation protein
MIVQRQREHETASHELEVIEGTLAEERGQLEGMRAELAEAQSERNEIIRQQSLKREEIAGHAAMLREERKGHDASVSTIHDLEMKINGLRTRAESLMQRAKEELELVLGSMEIAPANDIDIAGLRERLKQIKERIRSLGTVNLLAYEEWMQESERLAFLKGQSEDLINAEKTLINTINEINETAQAKFVETFEKIRENFTSIFTSLFMEGDEADLRIAEGDPLEAQIEIIAKPRGKRPHSIDLLSGGEKTLTAIALLFSIYLVKPSPFCILDEVDAPLDDANIDRFIQLVRRFDKETQFIIVTHNKRTMSAADTMYGVTQEEDGVSKIVSVRFEEKERRRVGEGVRG